MYHHFQNLRSQISVVKDLGVTILTQNSLLLRTSEGVTARARQRGALIV